MILFLFLAHEIEELLFISVPEQCLHFIEQKPCEPSDFGFLWLVHWMSPFVVPGGSWANRVRGAGNYYAVSEASNMGLAIKCCLRNFSSILSFRLTAAWIRA